MAIVGYTNAGKSTLLNRLTEAGVRAEDKLFATLDPTTRRVRLESGREMLLTDTVGFIQKLPTALVASFRATLEEVTDADVVLHLVDASAAVAVDHAATVDLILAELAAGERPRVVALNKIDLLGSAGRRRVLSAFAERYPRVMAISAATGAGLPALLTQLESVVEEGMEPIRILVPYGRESVLHEFRQVGSLEGSEFKDAGTVAWGRAPRSSMHRFRGYLEPAATESVPPAR